MMRKMTVKKSKHAVAGVAAKQQEFVRAERLAFVAKLYTSGMSQLSIGEKVGVSQVQISKDLAEIRATWLAKNQASFDEKIAEQLAKIDNLEAVAWQAWERSCMDAVTKSTKFERVPAEVDDPETADEAGRKRDKRRAAKVTVTGSVETMRMLKSIEEEKRTGQVGDDKFLARIAWCIDTRLRIFGGYKEQRVTNNIIQLPWDELFSRSDTSPALDPVEQKILEAGKPGNVTVVDEPK